MTEIKTHDDYWEAKKQIARLSDALERGMMPGVWTEDHLMDLIGKAFKWEMAHPKEPMYTMKLERFHKPLWNKALQSEQPKKFDFQDTATTIRKEDYEPFKGLAYYYNKKMDQIFLTMGITLILLGACGVAYCIYFIIQCFYK